MIKQIYEILEEASKASEPEVVLQKNNSATLQQVLKHCFDPSIVYKLPEGKPPFKALNIPVGFATITLFTETRRTGYLWSNPPVGLKKYRLEALFTEMLEGMHASDVEIQIAMKDKTLTKIYPKITEDVVRKAFPILLPQKAQKETSNNVANTVSTEIKNGLTEFIKPLDTANETENAKPKRGRKVSGKKKSTKKQINPLDLLKASLVEQPNGQ